MTLVELLIAMSVVTILMLGGVAVYFRMNRGFALRSATSSIEGVLRSARAFAIHERGPAVVVAEPQPDSPDPKNPLVGSVYALGRQTVSNWHFEKEQFAGSKVLGALGQEATVPEGTAGQAPGKIGSALSLDGATRLEVTSPYLDGLREGVFIECYVCPQAAPAGTVMPIVMKDTGSSWPYTLGMRGGNSFELSGAVRVAGSSDPIVATTAPLVPAGEWSHVALSFYRDGRTDAGTDRAILILSVNGEEAARTPVEGGGCVLAPNTGALHIGWDGANRFRGLIDELKIAGLVAGEVHTVPKNTEVRLDAGGSRDGRVHFDAEGKLDKLHHTRPVLFRILGDPVSHDERLLRTVRVTWLGCVEVFQGEPPAEQ